MSQDGAAVSNLIAMKCLANIVNLAVKECMSQVHDETSKIKRLVSVMKCSVTKRDLTAAVKKELNVECELPDLQIKGQYKEGKIKVLQNHQIMFAQQKSYKIRA